MHDGERELPLRQVFCKALIGFVLIKVSINNPQMHNSKSGVTHFFALQVEVVIANLEEDSNEVDQRDIVTNSS